MTVRQFESPKRRLISLHQEAVSRARLFDRGSGKGGGIVGKTFIQDRPPQDGKSYDCQCARCGSSCDWSECEHCGGEGVDGHECGEDCCCCADPEENIQCDICVGHGGFWECLSGVKYCLANPLPGRENQERGDAEWFEVADDFGAGIVS